MDAFEIDPGDRMASDPEPGDCISHGTYQELLRRARAILTHRRLPWTPETHSLVHRSLIKAARAANPPRPDDRPRFLSYMTKTMRTVLVDLARERKALKRGDGKPADTLEDRDGPEVTSSAIDTVLDLHEKLGELALHDPALADVVEARFFGELSMREIAEMKQVQESEVQRQWTFARTLFRAVLDDYDPGNA